MSRRADGPAALEMWGGVECTVNRVGDAYFTQLERSGHAERDDDLDRFAALGIRAAPLSGAVGDARRRTASARADWSLADARLPALRAPRHRADRRPRPPRQRPAPHRACSTRASPTGWPNSRRAVAARFPGSTDWTPVNEPLTTARFSALYGLWYPHARDDRSFVAALLNQCRATVLAMAAIRRVNPAARLVQTDDLSRTYGTERAARTSSTSTTSGAGSPGTCCAAASTATIRSGTTCSRAAPAPPSSSGSPTTRARPTSSASNYYVTSERWLDHRLDRYPGRSRGDARHATSSTSSRSASLATPAPGIAPLLEETWQRYRHPRRGDRGPHRRRAAKTSCAGCSRSGAPPRRARDAGADVRAVTAWSLLGSFDWNCLLGECRGYYEPGPFDVRAPTAAPDRAGRADRASSPPAARAEPPGAAGRGLVAPRRPLPRPSRSRRDRRHAAAPAFAPTPAPHDVAPILDQRRERHARPRLRDDLRAAATSPAACSTAPAHGHRRPGLGRGGDRALEAVGDRQRERLCAHRRRRVRRRALPCARTRVGPAVLADACAGAGIRLRHVLERPGVRRPRRPALGRERRRRRRSTSTARSKADAERDVLARCPQRAGRSDQRLLRPVGPRTTSSPAPLRALARGETFRAADRRARLADLRARPRQRLPRSADRRREPGIWHLANVGDVSWAEFAARAATLAGVATSTLRAVHERRARRRSRRGRATASSPASAPR